MKIPELNLKWSVADMDRLEALCRMGTPIEEIAALTKGKASKDEVIEVCRRNGFPIVMGRAS